MDFLKKLSLSTKVIGSVAILLATGLTVVAIQWESEIKSPRAATISPVAPEPSKENVGKQVQQRIEHLKKVVAKNPLEWNTAFELARMLQDGHDLPGALSYYEVGLKSNPKNVEGRVDYSLCLYQSGKEQESFKQNRMVLLQDESNAHALYNLGAIYGNRGLSDSATYYWGKLITAHPRDDLSKKAKENLKQLGGPKKIQ